MIANEPQEARAHWLTADRLAWDVYPDSTVRLHFSADGALEVAPAAVVGGKSFELQHEGSVAGELLEKFPHLEGLPLFRIAPEQLPRVPVILKQQLLLSATGPEGVWLGTTAIQPAGVLDDLFAHNQPLGVNWTDGVPTLRVWAPTARAVRLLLFDNPDPSREPDRVVAMTEDSATGNWSIRGTAAWKGMYYLYEVEVYARSTGRFETNPVTDPYAVSLSMDSARAQIVDLEDTDLQPKGWAELKKPPLEAPEDIVLYELHVRDFSINDREVPAALQGTFAAFALDDSAGLRHLQSLADAGLTHIHLLPAFDCASVPENAADQANPGDLSAHGPASEAQQAAIAPIRDRDAFNWCYDPWHYTVPEGSYSTDPDGPRRILDFREMVMALNRRGLRVVMDVVYNHTAGRLQEKKSVLDRIVPDYYHRLDQAGNIETSTCCANTATEHHMMERLMLDSLRTWATAYRVDGFRFDLMGHHSRASIEKARDLLYSLTMERDGVDGSAIYLYGEGWNFGEVANNARFVQATQTNMGRGTGVGTFNDRLRDAVRGGDHDDRGMRHVRKQGFVNGLFTDPNARNDGDGGERTQLLQLSDLLRTGLAGGIADYELVDRSGRAVQAGQIDYHGQSAAYASDPQETINYAAAHDNETLFDINQYKLPQHTSAAQRVRAQNLANSIVALAQGVPFFHAGQDMLRSKSLDRNSFNSGDWFNLLDFSYGQNGWGRGLPPEWDNRDNWQVARRLLPDARLTVGTEHITAAHQHLLELLRIRRSSPLFRLRTGQEVKERLRFHNTGPDQLPGVIVMSLSDDEGEAIVVIFNADTREHTVSPSLTSPGEYRLHPVQQQSCDPVVRRASWDAAANSFRVPGRTTAVFLRDAAPAEISHRFE